MRPRIRYHSFESAKNRAHIQAIVERYQYLLPHWLHELSVEIRDELDPGVLKNTISWSDATPEYGDASLYILSKLLDRPETLQHSCILHEILHIAHYREYILVSSRLLAPLQDRNEELHAYLVEDYRERDEEFIECLTEAILNQETHDD